MFIVPANAPSMYMCVPRASLEAELNQDQVCVELFEGPVETLWTGSTAYARAVQSMHTAMSTLNLVEISFIRVRYASLFI